MAIEIKFVRHETCEFPGTCRDILCQRALVIRQEVGYVATELNPSTNDLKSVVETAICKHQDALDAIADAQVLLGEGK